MVDPHVMKSYEKDLYSVLALLVLTSWAPFFLTHSSSYTSTWMRFYFELFILPGMIDAGLNCKIPQLYIHCLHLQSITAFRCFSAGRLLITTLLSNALLPAPQSLHCFAHTLITPDVKQYSVFKRDLFEF